LSAAFLIVGTLNVIYGIGALDSANIFVNDKRYIFTDLNTLGLNPLVVLVVTIGAGALFGMIGLTLATPLTSAAVHIADELRERGRGDVPTGPDLAPAPSG
jgi:hypothetical protein